MNKSLKGLNVILIGFSLITALVLINNTAEVSAAPPPSDLDIAPVISGLSQPIFVTNAHDESGRLFIAQQNGQIRIFKNGNLLSSPYLNIAGQVSNFTGVNSEQGLLAIAFDPNYSSNGYFYITYTSTHNDPNFIYAITLARYRVSSGNSDLADTSSGTVLLSIPKKYTNHNGGMIAFGPDGYLYMSTGDGGSGGDPDNNVQNLNTLLGKLLRLDVTSLPPPGKTYTIPSTNPFYGNASPNIRQEVWAYGLRNAWRFSFDRLSKDLFIGDVGQGAREEINFQSGTSVGGENYGWRVMEGSLCYNPSSGCNQTGKVLPVTDYDHSLGCSVTGGYVYRGTKYPSLYGYYFYGDFCTGRLFSLYRNSGSAWESIQLLDTPYNISTFGEDEQGEIYLADYTGGKIYSIGIGPEVTSVTRASGSPTIATNVNFTVTFSESVTGVDTSFPFADFSLSTTGVSGASISGVNGSGSVYTVTVNTGSGTGTIRLDIPVTATITNLSGNSIAGLPYTNSEAYTLLSGRSNKPDLIITNVIVNPSIPAANTAFEVNITITNQGSAGGANTIYRDVYIDRDPSTLLDPITGCPPPGDFFISNSYASLPAGMTDTKTVTITGGLPSGNHQFWFYVDSRCLVDEGGGSNSVP